MRSTTWQMWIAAMILGTAVARVGAQQCDDFDPCTTNDMCTEEGFCSGAPKTSGSCDDNDECTVNDTCTEEGCRGTATNSGSCDDFNECTINDHCTLTGCTGTNVAAGTGCEGGCGTCQPLGGFPIPGIPFTCQPVEGASTCELGPSESPCLVGACQVFGIPGFQTTLCLGRQKLCPDTDGNHCNDACNPETGECETGVTVCIPGCEACNPETGTCQPTNIGGVCDDFDQCTLASHCDVVNLGGSGERGFCVPGAPVAATPTRTSAPPTATNPVPTNTAALPTATRTAGAATATPSSPAATNTPGGASTPTQVEATRTPGGATCQGDCDTDGIVKVNELILQVNIALEKAELSRCTAGDGNNDGRIAINELIRATGNALNGCAAAAGL